MRDHDEHDHHLHDDHTRGPRGGRRPAARGRGQWAGGRGRGSEHGGWGGGRRMRRGDVRRAILAALRDQPDHGYAVMRHLEEMSGGAWRPSPGSVYPHLQMLEDEGLVTSSSVDGTRIFQLTDSGAAEAAQGGPMPWSSSDPDDVVNLRLAAAQLMAAAKQLSGAGDAEQVTRGTALVQKARKDLYQILAED